MSELFLEYELNSGTRLGESLIFFQEDFRDVPQKLIQIFYNNLRLDYEQ